MHICTQRLDCLNWLIVPIGLNLWNRLDCQAKPYKQCHPLFLKQIASSCFILTFVKQVALHTGWSILSSLLMPKDTTGECSCKEGMLNFYCSFTKLGYPRKFLHVIFDPFWTHSKGFNILSFGAELSLIFHMPLAIIPNLKTSWGWPYLSFELWHMEVECWPPHLSWSWMFFS